MGRATRLTLSWSWHALDSFRGILPRFQRPATAQHLHRRSNQQDNMCRTGGRQKDAAQFGVCAEAVDPRL